MYGIKQAAILVYTQLAQRLEKRGCVQVKSSTGFFKHVTCKTVFALAAIYSASTDKVLTSSTKVSSLCPHKWNRPAYGAKTQYALEPDTSQCLDDKGKRHVQSVVGTFLFYGRAVEPTILPTLNELRTQQLVPTEQITMD
eukprot:15339093-Ditylum_brightwellii.AAC.1